MIVNAPERSLKQRLDALETANTVRTERSVLKKDMKAGRVNVYGLIRDPPGVILTMKIWDFLMAVPKFGRVKVTKALRQCSIAPSKTMGGMTERQRNDLSRYLLTR